MLHHMFVSLCLAAVLLPAAHCGGDDPVPSWHPHKLKRRDGVAGAGGNASAAAGGSSATTPGAGPAASAGFGSTLSCGVLSSPEWERRVCFGPLAVTRGGGAAGLHLASLNLTVSRRPAGASASAPWEPACGAALRLVLASRRALLAPDVPLQEAECGVHPLHVTLPRDAPAYEPQLRLLHPEAAPGAALGGAGDEPPLLNARVAVQGALTLPPDAWDDPEGRLPLHMGGTDAFSLNTAQYPRFEEGGRERPPSARDPACSVGDARGRWAFTHDLYGPLELGEPLTWRPHGCHLQPMHGHRTVQCATRWASDALGGSAWLFAGGSQLAQLAQAIGKVVANETYYWTRLAAPDVDGNAAEAAALAGRTVLARRVDTAAEARAAGLDALPVPDDGESGGGGTAADGKGTHAWVLGLGAADAAAGTPVHAFADDVAGWLAALRAAVVAGTVPPPRRVVWVTAAAAAYKPGPGIVGAVSCAPGAPSCAATVPGAHYAAAGPGGGFAFQSRPLPRTALGGAARRLAPAVRALNAAAVTAVRAAFPEALVVDYEAMTEALPADYSVDGTHWGCAPWLKISQCDDDAARAATAAGGPYRCRSLANTAAGTALLNVLCHGVV